MLCRKAPGDQVGDGEGLVHVVEQRGDQLAVAGGGVSVHVLQGGAVARVAPRVAQSPDPPVRPLQEFRRGGQRYGRTGQLLVRGRPQHGLHHADLGDPADLEPAQPAALQFGADGAVVVGEEDVPAHLVLGAAAFAYEHEAVRRRGLPHPQRGDGRREVGGARGDPVQQERRSGLQRAVQ